MSSVHSGPPNRDRLLRYALRLDAVVSGAIGVDLVAAATWLDGALGVPPGWLRPVGLFLIAWAAGLLWLGARPRIPAAPVVAIIAANVLWAAGSFALIARDAFALTSLGVAFTVIQAVGTLAFAEMQYAGLRRTRTPARIPARV